MIRKFASWPVLIGLLLIFLAMFLVGGAGNALDVGLIRCLAELRNDQPELTAIMILLTSLGSAAVTLGLGTCAVVMLALQKKKQNAVWLAVGIVGERLLVDGLKWVIDRPRPASDVQLVTTSSSSFPSGHSANSIAVFLMIILACMTPRTRRPAIVLAIGAALMIGATRPFLGVHWPSDVLGGWATGLMAVWLFVRAGRANNLLPMEQQHQIV